MSIGVGPERRHRYVKGRLKSLQRLHEVRLRGLLAGARDAVEARGTGIDITLISL
jgi:hypothetical protein